MDQQQIQVKAGDQELRGTYSNAMQLSHSQEEFFLDFFLITPPQGQLMSRIITSPGHMKRIATAINDNIKLYESTHGKITEAEQPRGEIGFKTS